jgi:hypothetical protein
MPEEDLAVNWRARRKVYLAGKIQDVERKITEIRFLLNKEDWTPEDIAKHGEQEDLGHVELDLFNQKKDLAAKMGHVEPVLPSPNFTSYSETPRPESLPPLADSAKFFELTSDYLNGSGQSLRESKLLYCRKDFRDLFKFLKKKAIVQKKTCYVLGSPGAGKSVTVLSFVSTMKKDSWKILWIHIKRDCAVVECTILEPNSQKVLNVNMEKVDDIFNEAFDPNLRSLIVLDGLTNEVKYAHLKHLCEFWKEQNKTARHLIFACSMGTRYKSKPHNDKDLGIEEFLMSTWTLEELQEAVEDPAFLARIKQFLDVGEATDPKIRVIEKYYYTGGSARHMFDRKTAEVILSIRAAFQDVDAVLAGHQSTGALFQLVSTVNGLANEPDLINEIYDPFFSENETTTTAFIASNFIADLISAEINQRAFDLIQFLFRGNLSGFMNSLIFECSFFVKLRSLNGVKLISKPSRGKEQYEIWQARSRIKLFDSNNFPKLKANAEGWLKPKRTHELGYDAVYLNIPEGYVRFVKTAIEDSHECNLQHFADIIREIKECNSEFLIKKLEIFYVIHVSFLNFFQLNTTNEGLLAEHGFEGWGKDKIKIVGIA